MVLSKKCLMLKLSLLLLIIFECQSRDLRSSPMLDDDLTMPKNMNETSNNSSKSSSGYDVADLRTHWRQIKSNIHSNTGNHIVAEVEENWDIRELSPKEESSYTNSQQKMKSISEETLRRKPKKKVGLWSKIKNWLFYSSGGSALEENRRKGVGHLFEDFEPIESTVPEPSMHRANSPKRLANSQVQAESVIESIPNAQIGESEIISQNPPSNQQIKPLPKTQVVESQPISQNPPHPKKQSKEHEQKQNENSAPIIKVKNVKNPFPKENENPSAAVFKYTEQNTKLQGAEQTVRKIECCSLNNCKPGQSCGCCAGLCVQGGCCIICGCINGWLTATFWAEIFTKIGNRFGLFP